MEITKTLYVKNRTEWRNWLSKHQDGKETEIWLVYYRKSSGKPRIPYNDAVEEALCFGWIDSIVKRIDDEKFAQRFSPRRKTSILSRMNIERVKKLIEEKRMTKRGLDAIAHRFDPNEKDDFKIAKDILAEIKKDKLAWKHFQQFPERYKRIRISYVEEIRNYSREQFKRRLRNFIKNTAKNKRFGMVRE
ncbi:MAG: YdeI/OmpD-associated family protein [Candidatus Micrarchaeia archaeon]